MTRLILLLPALALLATAPAAQTVQMQGLGPPTVKLVRNVLAEGFGRFSRLPQVRLTSQIGAICGGGEAASGHMRYCLDDNAIFVAADLGETLPEPGPAAYLAAHMLGHGVQVRHGRADAALAEIAAAHGPSAGLRADLERQADCIAGVIFSGLREAPRGGPSDWFAEEPFTAPHMGTAPLSAQKPLAIGLGERDRWFAQGREGGGLAACTVGDLSGAALEGAERR